MTLSRFFVFQPWFLLGYYCKKNNLLERSLRPKRQLLVLFASVSLIVIIAFFVGTIPKKLLYGSYPYSSSGGTLWMRGITSVMSCSAILFLFVGMRPYLSRRFILITNIGQNTFPIFLLHGFIIRIAPVYFPHLIASPQRIILLSCIIVLLFGNQLCKKAIYYTCFSWLERYAAGK